MNLKLVLILKNTKEKELGDEYYERYHKFTVIET